VRGKGRSADRSYSLGQLAGGNGVEKGGDEHPKGSYRVEGEVLEDHGQGHSGYPLGGGMP